VKLKRLGDLESSHYKRLMLISVFCCYATTCTPNKKKRKKYRVGGYTVLPNLLHEHQTQLFLFLLFYDSFYTVGVIIKIS